MLSSLFFSFFVTTYFKHILHWFSLGRSLWFSPNKSKATNQQTAHLSPFASSVEQPFHNRMPKIINLHSFPHFLTLCIVILCEIILLTYFWYLCWYVSSWMLMLFLMTSSHLILCSTKSNSFFFCINSTFPAISLFRLTICMSTDLSFWSFLCFISSMKW